MKTRACTVGESAAASTRKMLGRLDPLRQDVTGNAAVLKKMGRAEGLNLHGLNLGNRSDPWTALYAPAQDAWPRGEAILRGRRDAR